MLNRNALLMILCGLLIGACASRGAAPRPAEPELAAGTGIPAHDPPGSAVDAPLGLPALQDLDRLASHPLDYTDMLQSGNGWDPGLPNLNMSNATFQPGLNEESQRLEPAYAIYSWEGQQDQQSPLSVLLGWVSDIPAAGALAVGVANFSSGRWEWQQGSEGQLFFSDTADHLSAMERIYVAVVLQGEQSAALQYMLLGTTPPWLNVTDDLDNDPLMNLAPREVTLDASDSFVTVHPISHFDFDWDGDGTWDVENDEDGIATHLYNSGNHVAIVRVTDTAGYSDTLEREIDIVDPLNQAPLAAFTMDEESGAAPLSVQFDPAASMDPDGQIVEYRWDFDNDGDWDEETDGPELVSHTYTTLGEHLVTLEVEDNFFGTGQFQLTVTITSGWTASEVAAAVLPDSWLAMSTTGEPGSELASIAFVDSSGAVHVVRSASATGDSWEAPQDPAPTEDRLTENSRLEMITATDGQTVLLAWDLFDNFQGGRQISFSSGNAGVWQEPLVINDSDDIALADLQLLDGTPMIGAIVKQKSLNFSHPVMYLAADPAGLAWGAQQSIQAPEPDRSCMNLALGSCLVEGVLRPLAVISSQQPPSSFLTARRAADAGGTSWEQALALSDSSAVFLELPVLDGIPVAFQAGEGNTQPISAVRATDAAASGFETNAQTISSNRCGNMSIVELAGKPVMCCYDRGRNRITLYRADDAAGTAWLGPEIVVDSPDTGRRIAMTAVAGELLLAWQDASDNLMCAWYQH